MTTNGCTLLDVVCEYNRLKDSLAIVIPLIAAAIAATWYTAQFLTNEKVSQLRISVDRAAAETRIVKEMLSFSEKKEKELTDQIDKLNHLLNYNSNLEIKTQNKEVNAALGEFSNANSALSSTVNAAQSAISAAAEFVKKLV